MIKKKAKIIWGVKTGTIYMAFSYTLTTIFVLGFQMIAIRLLNPEQYGLVSVLYSSVVFSSLFLGHTFEITLSNFVSEYDASEKNYFLLIKRVWLIQIITLMFFILLSFLFKKLIIQGLFPEVPNFFYIFIACGVFYSIEIGLRGVMRGLREFGLFGALIVTQNLFRIIYLLLFVVVLNKGLFGAGLSILMASVTNLLITIFWYHRVWNKLKGHQSFLNDPNTLRQLLKFILPTMAMFGCSTYFYNTGPSFIKLLGGSSANEMAGLFLIAVMISRLPLQLSEALSTNLLPNMSRLCTTGDWRQIRYYIIKSYQIFIPLALIAIVGVYLLGPIIIRIIYPEFSYDRLGLTMLMVATSVIMLVAAFIQFLLARKKIANVVIGWLVGSIVLTLIIFLLPGNILFRLETGYLAGGISIWVCLGIFTYRALNEMKSEENQIFKEISQ
ncbi:MAG: lipopolysaccharide biosynthesis protein [Anaerolineaceae bacterium]